MDRIKSNWRENNDISQILNKISVEYNYLKSNLNFTTKNNVEFRINLLKQLSLSIIKNRVAIEEAQQVDLFKSPLNLSINEMYSILKEIQNTVKNLYDWAKDKPMKRSQNSISYLRKEPRGLCLIICPWNYPLQLPLLHLISSIAAGNAVMLKLSEFTPRTNEIMTKVLVEVFPSTMLSVIEGDIEITEELLKYSFDHIHYTGSSRIAKKVLQAAANNLSTTSIDLVGKSPVFIDKDVNISIVVDEIIQAKFMNAGQNGIAPDFILINNEIKEAFLRVIVDRLKNNLLSQEYLKPEYNKILNYLHFDRLYNMYEEAIKLNAIDVTNGIFDRRNLYIEPCILIDVPINSRIIEDEIFGPILPIVTYENICDAIQMVNGKDKALAMYIFSNNKEYVDHIISNTQSKTVSINSCNIQKIQSNIPIGSLNILNLETSFGRFGYNRFTFKKVIFEKVQNKSVWNIFNIKLKYT